MTLDIEETPSLKLVKQPHLQFGATTFFAKLHTGDTCGSNGLPLTPNSIIIYGKAQNLKTIIHPHLCQYLDILRGKHERTVVVSQYCGEPISKYLGKDEINLGSVKKIAYQMIVALNVLHSNNIVHRNLCTENVMYMQNGDIKLFNYGLYYMSNSGKLVSFPIMQLLYTAPEVYLQGPNSIIMSTDKVDIWSLGMVLVELTLNKPLWNNSLKLGQGIRKILSLIQCNTSIFERIAREHNCIELYQELDEDLRLLIDDCLNIFPMDRPDCEELLKRGIFKEFVDLKANNLSQVCEPFEIFGLKELYHWWQLAGGDVLQELKKQGLIRSSPPILSLPKLVLLDGTILGQERNPTTLYDPRVVQMPLEALYERLQNLPITSFYAIIHINSKIIANSERTPYDVHGLPLIIRERDSEYQFHRIILFRRLLHGYPFTRELILKEACTDIPPLLRGDIWAGLLNVRGDYVQEFVGIDKLTPTVTDRQIEVDIPRCHQYNELLSSGEGHRKLKRILKAWVKKNEHYVYWQGLDSLTAPFLFLNFNNEAKAFACLSAFIPKYLHKFFLKDNSAIIQEYLAKFSQLIAFHDPELANHLSEISFIPELFAIPWFLTMFSHVFPLHKIFHLWDKLLLGDSSFPIHIGLSVLTQLRKRLLESGFNECILLFSDLPEVDIETCLNLSQRTYHKTPRSITSRMHQNKSFDPPSPTELEISGVTFNDLKSERCPRISANDVVKLINKSPKRILIVDIRNPTQFNHCAIIGSINIPISSVKFGESDLVESFGAHGALLAQSRDKNIVIVGNEDTDLVLFPKFLLERKIARVSILHGGFNVLLSVNPSVLTSHISAK